MNVFLDIGDKIFDRFPGQFYGRHLMRVGGLTNWLTHRVQNRFGLTWDDRRAIYLGAVSHDNGKMADSVRHMYGATVGNVFYPESLVNYGNDQHQREGVALLSRLRDVEEGLRYFGLEEADVAIAATIIRFHHTSSSELEKMDLPMVAKIGIHIVRIADLFDAKTSGEDERAATGTVSDTAAASILWDSAKRGEHHRDLAEVFIRDYVRLNPELLPAPPPTKIRPPSSFDAGN